MQLREDKMKSVMDEIGVATFCYGRITFTNSFYEDLTDEERAEVCRRIKRGDF